MKAIVLKRRNFREYDQIISLYTLERGKIELLAKGVKKNTSKNSSFLEPMSFLDVESVKGKEFEYLTNVQIIDYFPNIRKDLKKSFYVLYILSFANKILEENEGDKNIFFLFLGFLSFIEKASEFKKVFVDIFIFKLFAFLGFRPVLENCSLCSSDKDLNYFSFDSGLICTDCQKKNNFLDDEVILVEKDIIKKLSIFLENNFEQVDIELGEYLKIHELIYGVVRYHLEKKIIDWA